MIDAVHDLFDRYRQFAEQGLRDELNYEELASCYADEFIASGPQGVMTGRNDASLVEVMRAGYARYRAIGTKRMAIRTTAVDVIDEMHCIAHIGWRATYGREGMDDLDIDFEVHYLLRVERGAAKIFGWIAGDEAGLLKKHGIG